MKVQRYKKLKEKFINGITDQTMSAAITRESKS